MVKRKLTWVKTRILLDWFTHKRARALLYHSIADTPNDQFSVSPHQFIQQMEWLAQSNYHVITNAQLLDFIQSGAVKQRLVVLTFDDGYENFYSQAMPVLHAHGLTAIQFIPTGYIMNSTGPLNDESSEARMTESQIEQAINLGFEIGSHTASHPSLPELPQIKLEAELADSLAQILTWRTTSPPSLAYPYGRTNPSITATAQKVGYKLAYLAGGLWGNGKWSNPYLLTRTIIHHALPLTGFEKCLSGWMDIQLLLRDLFHIPAR